MDATLSKRALEPWCTTNPSVVYSPTPSAPEPFAVEQRFVPLLVAALLKGSKIGWPSVASRVAAVSWISWQSASSGALVWGRAPA
jgi:hypothetical protein